MARGGPAVGSRIRVEAGRWTAAGEAQCAVDGVEVRVRGLIPGEAADVTITHRSRGGPVAWGTVDAIARADAGRREAPCPLEGTCGGCGLQHAAEEARLRHLVDSRTAELPGSLRAALAPEDEWIRSPGFGWRHKAVFLPRWRDGLELGGFARGTHDVVDQPECQVLAPAIRAARDALRDAFAPRGREGLMLRPPGAAPGPGLRALVVRANRAGEVLVTAVVRDAGAAAVATEVLAALADGASALRAGELVGAHVQICDASGDRVHGNEPARRVAGAARLTETVGGVGLPVLPLAFFQVNPWVLEGLVQQLRVEAAGASGILDAYCGVGALGIAVAAGLDPRPRLWGFDVVGAGVEEARRRAADAGLEADYRIGAFGIVDGVQPDVAIVDPPRKGCGPAAITALLESRPKTLLYVSCHAASLGRDTARIEELGYTATTLWPADMLPQTGHLELLARFDLQTG